MMMKYHCEKYYHSVVQCKRAGLGRTCFPLSAITQYHEVVTIYIYLSLISYVSIFTNPDWDGFLLFIDPYCFYFWRLLVLDPLSTITCHDPLIASYCCLMPLPIIAPNIIACVVVRLSLAYYLLIESFHFVN